MINTYMKGKKCEFGDKCSKENKRKYHEEDLYAQPRDGVGLGWDALFRLVRRRVIPTVLTSERGT